MPDMSILGMVTTFIAVAIMLGIGTLILGGATTDCTGLAGYDDGTDDKEGTTDDAHTGWAKQCVDNKKNQQSAYALIMITLIVLAAAVILIVIRYLA